MDEELKRHISEASEIKNSGRWKVVNQNIRQLADNPRKHEAWQVQVLASLCAQNFSEYLSLTKAYEQNTPEPSLLAWRARNLLEISVWAIYCAQSKENARAFYEDAGRDVIGVYDAFTKWGNATSQDNDWLSPFDVAKQDISQRAKSEGIETLGGAYQQVRNIAEKCGIGDHFRLSYKMLSKFAHPTAMLIMSAPDIEKEKLQKDIFYSNGSMFFVGGFNALEGCLSLMVNPE